MSEAADGPRKARKPADRGTKPKGEKPGAEKPEAEKPAPVKIRSVPKKIGEADDNLKRRSEWFRRRTATPERDQD